ncbi:MAG: hypothetical protein JSU64_03025 [candidate division WOR-3 bacterium]|nr:MAG: hypothetical protein JSU64_03025 [candidate division WOR-3 bacterium]
MITAFVICIRTDVHSQKLLFTEFTYGQFVKHTDNDLDITNEKNLKDSFGSTIGFQFNIKHSHSILLQIGYHRSVTEKATSFLNYVMDPLGNDYFVEKPIDLSFHAVPVDIQYAWSMHRYVNICIGPSFTGNIRKITVHYIDYYLKEKEFIDRLFGIGAGIAGSIQLSIPLSHGKRYCFISSMGFRYVKSLWFDAEGRELDDYGLSYSQFQISTGIGIRL